MGKEACASRSDADAVAGYRNGYGEPRRLAVAAGRLGACRPWVPGFEMCFEDRVLASISSPVESPSSAVCLSTKTTERYGRGADAEALIWRITPLHVTSTICTRQG